MVSSERGRHCCSRIKYEDVSEVENPKDEKNEITREELIEFEKFSKDLGILDISYLNNIDESGFKSVILLSAELDQIIIDTPSGEEAKKYNLEFCQNFGNLTYEISDYLRNLGFKTKVAHPDEDLIDFSTLAEKASMGVIGKSGLLIGPTFGPKQKISGILVNIENLPEPGENPYLWAKNYCFKCNRCIAFCQKQAFIGNRIEVKVDESRCSEMSEGCTDCIRVCPFYKKGYSNTIKKYNKMKK